MSFILTIYVVWDCLGMTEVRLFRKCLSKRERVYSFIYLFSPISCCFNKRWVSLVRAVRSLVSRLTSDGRARRGPEIPQARGSFGAVGGQAFFLPLYELYLTYGGIFRLIFGPKVLFCIVPTFWADFKTKLAMYAGREESCISKSDCTKKPAQCIGTSKHKLNRMNCL